MEEEVYIPFWLGVVSVFWSGVAAACFVLVLLLLAVLCGGRDDR